MNELESFKELNKIFKDHGYKLFLVGGTVRDFLKKIKLTDLDLVTNATPDQMKAFLDNADFTFKKYGFVKLKFEKYKFDITTLRKENTYIDSRHPSEIMFVDNLEDDVVRRDFTCNALYMDESLKIYDYVNGVNDLNNGILRMVGDPDIRLKEDPLRIIRAIRFSLTYNLSFDNELLKAIENNKNALKLINENKIVQDLKKIKNASKEDLINLLNKLGINLNVDMIKL